MANNYLEFSEVIENLTPEEIEWWKPDQNGCFCYNEVNETDDIDASLDEDNKLVWFRADESGDVEIIAKVVQKFLKQFRPNDFFSLTWSCTCSKPRIGEFSGGGMFITANEMKFFSVEEWVEQVKKEWSEDYGV